MSTDVEKTRWARLVELRPDQLQRLVDDAPVAYWPLGLIEHHGWHLPVGFDGLKAERFCERLAVRTGGAILPTMWWGAQGGHGPFKWTFYQEPEASRTILETTIEQLVGFGFRCIVLVAGHYPWRSLIGDIVETFSHAYPDVRVILGTEVDIAGPEIRAQGDHAARWETAYGLALLPEFIDLKAMNLRHEEREAWPDVGPPPESQRFPTVEFDVANPLFAQAGEDARKASAEEGAQIMERAIDTVAERVCAFLSSRT